MLLVMNIDATPTAQNARRRLGVGVAVLLALAACGRQSAESSQPKPAAQTAPAPTTTSTVEVTTTTAEVTTTTAAPAVAQQATRIVEQERPRPTTTTKAVVAPAPTTTSTTEATITVEPPPVAPAGGGGAVVVSHGGPVRDHVSLVDNLRGRGLTVVPEAPVSQPFLHAEGTILAVSGPGITPTRLQSFDYDTVQAAAIDAATFGPDGNPRGTSVAWVGPPHLYLKGRVLVIFVGSDPAVTGLLTDLLGPQFAGR